MYQHREEAEMSGMLHWCKTVVFVFLMAFPCSPNLSLAEFFREVQSVSLGSSIAHSPDFLSNRPKMQTFLISVLGLNFPPFLIPGLSHVAEWLQMDKLRVFSRGSTGMGLDSPASPCSLTNCKCTR